MASPANSPVREPYPDRDLHGAHIGAIYANWDRDVRCLGVVTK